MKIGIIIGTNRENSVSEKIGEYYKLKLEERQIISEILNFKNLPQDFAFSALYGKKNSDFEYFQKMTDEFDKIILIVPEYNGSYPGVLKTFIDGLKQDTFLNKKIALVGVSTGILGNAVGLGHLSDVLAYLNANVLGLRIKLGNISKHFSNQAFSNDVYANFVERQINTFLEF